MWALRRAVTSTRSHSCRILGGHTRLDGSGILGSNLGNSNGNRTKYEIGVYLPMSYPCQNSFSSISFGGSQMFCSQAGVKSNVREGELEDGFSDLETPPEVISDDEAEIADGASHGLSDAELDISEENKQVKKSVTSPLSKILLETPPKSITGVLDKWVEDGNPLGRDEISVIVASLCIQRTYGKALQFVEWLEAKKYVDLEERDCASHLHLIARVHGLYKAEQYLKNIPESLRGELVYRTLLAYCVATANIKKAEEVFKKMRDLRLPVTNFTCNQLLLLYKRSDRKKIGDVLLMMEKENIKPSLLTYKLLLDVKGRAHDVPGMEKILETMKAEGIVLDMSGQAMVARHYIFGGFTEKAEAVIKAAEGDSIEKDRKACRYLLPLYAMVASHYIFGGFTEKAEAVIKAVEGDSIEKNRRACKLLLPLYADLGRPDDVERVWKVCEVNPSPGEFFGAIEAWGKLGRIEDAEKVFERMIATVTKPSSKLYLVLLKVYANHKLLEKGKELVKRMSDNGVLIGPLTWDALVKLYVQAGDVEKADAILQKATQQNQIRPLYSSYLALLDQYSKNGDIHNSEKIFYKLRQTGFVPKVSLYQTLLQAYVNAKTPAYGFRERMKAENLYPSKTVVSQLAAIDALKKTQVSELLA